MKEHTQAKFTSYLSFTLGEELFAANVSKVLNILEMSKITRVPRMPEYMLGIINLRGLVLPVIDTRMKFGLPLTEFTIHTCILVLEVIVNNNIIQLGALVDGVQEVIDIEIDKILPPPTIGNKYNPEFITGVFKKDDDLLIFLLNMDYIFSNEDLLIIKEVKDVNEFV